MVLDLINILEHNPCEKNIIRKVKNHNPSKGEKGHWKGEKGRQDKTLGRLLKVK